MVQIHIPGCMSLLQGKHKLKKDMDWPYVEAEENFRICMMWFLQKVSNVMSSHKGCCEDTSTRLYKLITVAASTLV